MRPPPTPSCKDDWSEFEVAVMYSVVRKPRQYGKPEAIRG
jgi:hypothetical protein